MFPKTIQNNKTTKHTVFPQNIIWSKIQTTIGNIKLFPQNIIWSKFQISIP